MKRILLFVSILFLSAGYVTAQSYMNEWIDFNKTYYKFRTGGSGIFRIPQTQLANAGLGAVNAAHFQLWKNGEEVAIYTSVNSGALPADGFIEFWSDVNNGEWEKRLYLDPQTHINPVISLFSDSVTWFLTVNTTSPNKRIIQTNNDLSSGLPVETSFMHTARTGFRNNYNQGFAAVVGEYVYSSSFDVAEGYSTAEFRADAPFTTTATNLFVAPGGPDANLYYTAAGRVLNTRTVKVNVNGTQVSEEEMNYFNYIKKTVTVFLT